MIDCYHRIGPGDILVIRDTGNSYRVKTEPIKSGRRDSPDEYYVKCKPLSGNHEATIYLYKDRFSRIIKASR